MNELLVKCGGVHILLLIVFHLLFWRIFNWPESLQTLNRINRSTMQVLNLSITFIFAIFAYLAFAHTDELLQTALGRAMLVLISMLWLFRAGLQLIFYDRKHKLSLGLTAYFLLGALLFGIPGFS